MRLWRERRQKALDDFVLALRTRLNPEIHAERVDPIRLDPLPPGAGLPGFPGEPGEGGDGHGHDKLVPRPPTEAHGGGTGGESPAPR
jgi:hypothetical protein